MPTVTQRPLESAATLLDSAEVACRAASDVDRLYDCAVARVDMEVARGNFEEALKARQLEPNGSPTSAGSEWESHISWNRSWNRSLASAGIKPVRWN